MSSFSKMATVSASTKRSGGITDGLEAGFAENIASLVCLPLDPVTPELAQSYGLSWHETLETSTQGDLDILEGDILVVDGTDYPIRAVEEWTWKGSEFKRLLLEDRK